MFIGTIMRMILIYLKETQNDGKLQRTKTWTQMEWLTRIRF